MTSADGQPEYSQVVSTRHEGSASRSKSSRIRATYFSVAAFWGFIVGVLGVLTALQVEAGERFKQDAGIFIYLVPALVIAIAGGFVISRAYRDAKRK